MHTIRLRGPWEAEPLAAGRVRYSRRFHQPTGLDGGERVWLVMEAPDCSDLTLNGEPLDATAGRCEVTPLLRPGNLLSVVLATPASTDSLARLEIG